MPAVFDVSFDRPESLFILLTQILLLHIDTHLGEWAPHRSLGLAIWMADCTVVSFPS